MICRDDLNGNCDGEVVYEDGETRNMMTVGSDHDWCADYDDDGLLSFGVWIVSDLP